MSARPPLKLRILSYNIHKGFSGGIPKYTLKKMRDEIRRAQPDLIFLQEVHGEHDGHRRRVPAWPEGSQFEYLAEQLWPHFSYGRNAVYTEGHHGNAILSKHPILSWANLDLSQNSFERRGVLHAVIQLPGGAGRTHALCTHLGLFEWDRQRQLRQLAGRIEEAVPRDERVIAAGDFNDWRQNASAALTGRLGLREAFRASNGGYARTFPSWMPVLTLDRVYCRGFEIKAASVFDDPAWRALSDHLALWVELEVAG
jgi:endonuclease/exonuclease/phosphatase family metal-dependent hydrolase